MSWSIRRENVKLRVTKFAPDPAPAATAPSIRPAIEAHKERRRREQKKIEPAFPSWRREELARKYAPVDAYQPDEVCDE